jgi:hypothetical protein
MLHYVVWQKFVNISEVLSASIIRAMMMVEAVSTSEMSVNVYQTAWTYNPQDSHLHTRHRKNLKSYFYQTTWRNIPEESS